MGVAVRVCTAAATLHPVRRRTLPLRYPLHVRIVQAILSLIDASYTRLYTIRSPLVPINSMCAQNTHTRCHHLVVRSQQRASAAQYRGRRFGCRFLTAHSSFGCLLCACLHCVIHCIRILWYILRCDVFSAHAHNAGEADEIFCAGTFEDGDGNTCEWEFSGADTEAAQETNAFKINVWGTRVGAASVCGAPQCSLLFILLRGREGELTNVCLRVWFLFCLVCSGEHGAGGAT